MADRTEALGAVLAGGAARRLGGAKALAELGGRPLISYPLAAFAAAGIEAVVVAKRDTPLPPLGNAVVTEPGEPRHPLAGVVAALEHAGGRAVIVCACDLPFVPPALIARLAATETTTVAEAAGRLHPLLARYRPADLPALRDALASGGSATAVARSLGPALLGATERATFNVNSPADLAEAQRRLA